MPDRDTESDLAKALRSFDAAEANVGKLEQLWNKIEALIPDGVMYGDNPEYEDHCRAFSLILDEVPKIEGWKPESKPWELNEIASNRFDAMELGELDCTINIEQAIAAPGKDLREYRFRLNRARRRLIRVALIELITRVDVDLQMLTAKVDRDEPDGPVEGEDWGRLKDNVGQIDALLGSSVTRPKRWGDLRRHLHFGQMSDLVDIVNHDWPAIRTGLNQGLYGDDDPVPVGVEDLSTLVEAKPRGSIPTKLLWDRLSDEDFERLIYTLVGEEKGYENPQWLTHTNAADKGRDISVTLVIENSLFGTSRSRVIFQCRHQQSSVSMTDIGLLKEQMKLWEPPRVDMLVIATTGRFTTDAVDWIENHNRSDSALRIEMWAENHIERLLAQRPGIIAEFNLR